MGSLDGNTAFISGGSKGIGRAIGERFAAQGARIALCARNPEVLRAAAQEIRESTGGEVHEVPSDLSTAEGVARAVELAEESLGKIDILVNNAGTSPRGPIEALTDEDWAQALNLKVLGYIRMVKALLPKMVERGHGRIINIAGTTGTQPEGILVAHGVSNAAVISMGKSVAVHVAASGVTVNTICPGRTETERWPGLQRAFAEANGLDMDEALDFMLKDIPAGRVGTPEEMAFVAEFFASPEAGYVTGEVLNVAGGQVRGM
jgi:NAD(P)-dependent dehydrogenase (short-subunit alcohol dehydrogenase family)